jgi:hypothetical protein
VLRDQVPDRVRLAVPTLERFVPATQDHLRASQQVGTAEAGKWLLERSSSAIQLQNCRYNGKPKNVVDAPRSEAKQHGFRYLECV